MKIDQKKLRESFRPSMRVQSIAKLAKENPDYMYKGVRYDEALDPHGEKLDKYLDRGWEFVIDTTPVEDDRSNAPQSKDNKLARPKPLTKAGKGGAQFAFMRIKKDLFTENHKADSKKRHEHYLRSSGKKESKGQGSVKIVDSEINETNINNFEVDNNG